MSEKNFFIFLILIFLCKCEKNNEDLIRSYPYLIAIFVFILTASFILSLLIIFIPDKEKHEKNLEISIENNSPSDKIENTMEKSNMEPTNLMNSNDTIVEQNINNNKIDNRNIYKNKINQNKDNIVESKKLFNGDFIGRILFTILSLEPLLFIYNFIVQDILVFPGILYDMENKYLKYFFYGIYILFI